QVAIEPGLVDRRERPEAHRDRRELPELGHQARVRIRAEAVPADFAPEMVELLLAQTAFEEGTGIHARCGMALVEDLVAAVLAVLAPEEPVEADLVEAGRARVRGEVAADPAELVVRPKDHRDGVPADEAPEAAFERFIAGKGRLLLWADGVDVARLGERRQPDVELA